MGCKLELSRSRCGMLAGEAPHDLTVNPGHQPRAARCRQLNPTILALPPFLRIHLRFHDDLAASPLNTRYHAE